MYKCQFPGCEYETRYRSQINFHHIVPQEDVNTSNKSWNLICLCPSHHTKIYIPSASSGIHTVRGDDSIILKRWMQSTGGRVLEYIDIDGNVCYQN